MSRILLLASAILAAAPEPVAPAGGIAFDGPFLFSYGTWQDRVKVAGGRALLKGAGVTPKGGAGRNVDLDLGGRGEEGPVASVKVGAGNTLRALKLMLRDREGRIGAWEFAIPPTSAESASLTPKDGASLARPNATDKPGRPPDLASIMQWQLSGDWSGDGPVDLEVLEIAFVPPGADLVARRATLASKLAEERGRKLAEAREALARSSKGADSPAVEAAGLVAPDVLALTIQAGRVRPSSLAGYEPKVGDSKRADGPATILVRDGGPVGWLIGPKKDHLVTYEKLEGEPLLEGLAAEVSSYSLRSTDDPAYASPTPPVAVHRKSKPTDWAQPRLGFAMRHVVYLKLPTPLAPGRRYVVSSPGLNLRESGFAFACDPKRMRSEAVHSSQVGYRPDDPAKRAFLSLWMGTGGAVEYPAGLRFQVLEEETDHVAFAGPVELARRLDEPERMFRDENLTATNVYRMDFTPLKSPGRYRVSVEGIGCGAPFEVGPKAWERAFLVQMRGLYHQRSGEALGPPTSTFVKPRDFHPLDGRAVARSTYSILDGPAESPELERRSTGQPVPGAWGGYHDAGDWNPRRATHLRVTMAQLELMELFPAWSRPLKLGIPPTPGVPDLLAEALFEVDLFRRLQRPDGAVGFGIETTGDPIEGEVSWLQSMPAFAFAVDPWSSFLYAAAAGRAAKVLGGVGSPLAEGYRESALKAMRWAEADLLARAKAGPAAPLRWEVADDRNLAALVLYDLTGDRAWHEVFRSTTVLVDPKAPVFAWGKHVQRDAAFLYARLGPGREVDPLIRANALEAVESQARSALAYAGGNAFHLTTPDKGKPMFLGFYSTPDAVELARAHHLTGKAEYLAGLVLACGFAAGGNPNNMTYTTGLGSNPPRHPLHLDSRRTGQPAPDGLTVYGNFDFNGWKDQQWATWPITYYLASACTPSAWDWPIPEAYFDIFLYPATNEFTVDTWAPNVYAWGYLAARP